MRLAICGILALSVVATLPSQPPTDKKGHSPNIHPVSHLELGPFMTVGGLVIEQELSRPYVYVDRWRDEVGFDVIEIRNPATPKVIARWRMERPEQHRVSRGETGKYFKTHGRYYYIKSTEFQKGTLDADVGAIVFDVTDPTAPKEIGRIRSPEIVSGFVNMFPYAYRDGRVLVFAAVQELPDGVP